MQSVQRIFQILIKHDIYVWGMQHQLPVLGNCKLVLYVLHAATVLVHRMELVLELARALEY